MTEYNTSQRRQVVVHTKTELWAQLKAKAARQDRPLYIVHEDAIRHYLTNGEEKPQKMRRRR